MSLPDIVSSLKSFLSKIAQERRVIVAIDELDKVDSDVKAGQFLNDLKGIFGVPECFYLVSVSEEALSNFELRGLPFRDAFDSAFDEVAHFRYLSYAKAGRCWSEGWSDCPRPTCAFVIAWPAACRATSFAWRGS